MQTAIVFLVAYAAAFAVGLALERDARPTWRRMTETLVSCYAYTTMQGVIVTRETIYFGDLQKPPAN